MTLVAAYFMVGIGLAFGRRQDIAAETQPDDLASTIIATARWVMSWPLWAFVR